MKFLIFNIIVFFSLGYLLTSKPNENFNQWFGNTKDKISQISKKDIVSTIKKATSKSNDEEILKTSNNNKFHSEKNIENLANEKLTIKNVEKSSFNVKEKIKVENLTKEKNQANNIKNNNKEKHQIKASNEIQENFELNKKKFDVEKLIKQVLAEKKVNDLKLKTKKQDEAEKANSIKKVDSLDVKNVKNSSIKNKYMSNLERENALAELIIDMELYHLSTLKD